MVKFSKRDGAIIFNVRIVPNSSKSEIIGEFDGSLKIKIAAPPVDGAANAELIKVLAKKLGAAKSAIEIIGGQSSKNKQVKIHNIEPGVLSELFHR
jgi:uncharacterized protein (TIGR00251 family)